MRQIKIERITPMLYDISIGYMQAYEDEEVLRQYKAELHKAIDNLTFDDFISKNNDWGGIHYETRVLITTGKNGKE